MTTVTQIAPVCTVVGALVNISDFASRAARWNLLSTPTWWRVHGRR